MLPVGKLQARRGLMKILAEQFTEQAARRTAVAHLQRRYPLGLDQRLPGGCVIAAYVLRPGHVDQQRGAPFEQHGGQPPGVGACGSAQRLASVSEFGGHLDAVYG